MGWGRVTARPQKLIQELNELSVKESVKCPRILKKEKGVSWEMSDWGDLG